MALSKEVNESRMWGVRPSQDADPIPTKENAPLTSIQVEPKANALPIPVGKIPGGGTQVAVGGRASDETVTVHTVDSEKTLYLSQMAHSIENISGGAGTSLVYVTNDSDDLQYYMSNLAALDDHGHSMSISLNPPLELAAGWKIKVNSSASTLFGNCFIHGYEM